MVLVLYFTYYFTKTLSKKVTNYSTSKYIKIVDRIALSQNKFLVIIEIGDKKFLLSVTDSNINILQELDELTLEPIELDNDNSNIKFSDILKENLLKSKITSKFMKGNISYEDNKFNEKKDKK